ncbi:MAG: response regulator [Dongiaceae bacterium]
MRQPTALLVEDDVLVRMVTAEVLGDMGFHVEEAASAAEALGKATLASGGIDIAIIDVGLPDRKGDELAVDLRAMFGRLPIALATGYSETSLPACFAGDPFFAYLGKPYDTEQLTSVLASLQVGIDGQPLS